MTNDENKVLALKKQWLLKIATISKTFACLQSPSTLPLGLEPNIPPFCMKWLPVCQGWGTSKQEVILYIYNHIHTTILYKLLELLNIHDYTVAATKKGRGSALSGASLGCMAWPDDPLHGSGAPTHQPWLLGCKFRPADVGRLDRWARLFE